MLPKLFGIFLLLINCSVQASFVLVDSVGKVEIDSVLINNISVIKTECDSFIWVSDAISEQPQDSLLLYRCRIQNDSGIEQWVMIFKKPVFDLEVLFKNKNEERSYFGGLLKKGSYSNYKKRYSVSIPVFISQNIITDIILKIKIDNGVNIILPPEFMSLDTFIFENTISTIVNDFLLGFLVLIVLFSFCLCIILRKELFFYIGINILFIVLQCSNFNYLFDRIVKINPVYNLLLLSSSYIVFLSYIHIYKVLIAPKYHFPIINRIMNIGYVLMCFLFGMQVAVTLIIPGLILEKIRYIYLPFLIIILAAGILVTLRTEFKKTGISAIICAVGGILAIESAFDVLFRYVPLEIAAFLGGILLLLDALNFNFQRHRVGEDLSKAPSISSDSEEQNWDEHTKSRPLNILENIGSEVVMLKYSDIAYVKIENKTCCIYTFYKGVVISNRSLEYYENLFDKVFFRLNRQFLVSPEGIKKIEVSPDYQYIVTLECSNSYEIIKLTKNKTFLFKNWLTKIHSF